MSLGATLARSIPDLLRLLGERLGLEFTELRGISHPPAASAVSLEPEVESPEARAHDAPDLSPLLWNMLRPANRLPPEILSCIFQDFVDHAKDAAAIIPLTHVCQYWRESIISTPRNWTSISSRSEGLAASSLERADGAPLRIGLSTSEIEEGHWLPHLLVPYIQNTQTLNVKSPSLTELKRLLPNFPQSMPNLRSLVLSTNQISSWDRLVDPFESFVPALNSLLLTNVPLYPSLLQLRTLTELKVCDFWFNLRLDTLLDFLEENRSLTSATMRIRFTEPSLRSSRHRAAIRNRLRYLRIDCYKVPDGQALISSIALSKGAELATSCRGLGDNLTVNDVLSGISTTHLSNLLSPTLMKYSAGTMRFVRLFGPNGTASFSCNSNSDIPFVELCQLPLTSIRHFHLHAFKLDPPSGPLLFHHLSSLPALKAFIIDLNADLSHLSVFFVESLSFTLAENHCIAFSSKSSWRS